jgi:hypothetical protein
MHYVCMNSQDKSLQDFRKANPSKVNMKNIMRPSISFPSSISFASFSIEFVSTWTSAFVVSGLLLDVEEADISVASLMDCCRHRRRGLYHVDVS